VVNAWWVFFLLGIVVPLAVNEASDLGSWIASRVLIWGARRLGSPERAERYTEEWLANLERVPGKLTKLGFALSVVVWGVPRLRWQFSRQQRKKKKKMLAASSNAPVVPLLHKTPPCRTLNPDLWFSDSPIELNRAVSLCGICPVKRECLTSAVARQEPWGVWGGEVFDRGAIVRRRSARKRRRY